MKKEKDNVIKTKIDKKQIFTKIMAGVLLAAMVLASCSTCIYYVMSNVK